MAARQQYKYGKIRRFYGIWKQSDRPEHCLLWLFWWLSSRAWNIFIVIVNILYYFDWCKIKYSWFKSTNGCKLAATMRGNRWQHIHAESNWLISSKFKMMLEMSVEKNAVLKNHCIAVTILAVERKKKTSANLSNSIIL